MNNDLISRSALHSALGKQLSYRGGYISVRDIKNILDNAPAVPLLTASDIDELCRLRSDLKSGLYVGSTLRTQAQIDKFVDVLDGIIDNSPAVEIKTTYDVNSAYDRGYITAMNAYARPKGRMIIKPPSGWEYCSECGKVLEPQDKFCWNCGAEMVVGGDTE